MGVLVLTVSNRELDRRLASTQVRPAVVEQLVQEGVGLRSAMVTAAGLAAASALVAAVTIKRG
jgi:hypothetical protein